MTKFPEAGALEQATFHDIDGAINELDELIESLKNWFVGCNESFSKSYSDGNLCISIKIRELLPHPIDFTVVIQNRKYLGIAGSAPAKVETKGLRTFGGAPDCKSSVCGDVEHGHSKSLLDLDLSNCNRDDLIMFVHIVEFAQKPKRSVPSLVGLQSSNKGIRFRRCVFQLSNQGFFETLLATHDGKSVATSHLLPIRSNETAHHLVKGGSKIVNNVADDYAEFVGDAPVDSHTIDIISRLRILLADKFVWIALKEAAKGTLEIRGVSLCSFNLQLWPEEGVNLSRSNV